MNQNQLLALLTAVTAPTTVLTYNNLSATLVTLGIVKNENSLNALKLLESQMPPATPATLASFLSLINALVSIRPDSKPADHAKLEALLKSLAASDNPDPQLTWALFIPLLQQVIAAGSLRATHASKSTAHHK
jgi:hypothetical protein